MADKLESFKGWFIKGGGRLGDDVELHYDGQRNVHLRVAEGQELKSGCCIVSCPHALTLSQFNVRRGRSSLDDAPPSCAASVTSLNLLRFFLIDQSHLGTQSFWWPYINILPQPFSDHPFDTPLYYTEDDARWIRGTSLEHSRRKTEEMWRDERAQGLRAMCESNSDRYPWELYKWAATIISSRSFPSSAVEARARSKDKGDIEPCPALLPGLDLLNHDPTAQVTWQWTEEACCISTDNTLPGGVEVFNNYAPKSNEELIMGYGFSFFRNASDHCNIALGALAVARVEDVLRHRALAPSSKDLSEAGGLSATEPAIKTTGDHSVTGIGWVRLLPADHAGARVKPNQRPYIFSESFLQLASIAFFNARETTTGIPIIDANLCSANLTRNKLHTLCAIAMILQKQCARIIESNSDLPPWPLNPRQFHAARYRRGQLLILRTVSSSFVADLRRLAGFDRAYPRDKRILRLEHILKTGPREFLQDFRAALHIGLGTRDAAKIREQNLVESAFTLWLCGLWLWTLPKWSSESKSLDRPPLLARTASWIAFVGATYGDGSAIGKQWARLPASQEGQLLAESYHCIVEAAAAKNPQSVYNRSEATTGQLLWCLRVVREESFVCPSLGGEIGDDVDEIVLFLEDRAPFADTI